VDTVTFAKNPVPRDCRHETVLFPCVNGESDCTSYTVQIPWHLYGHWDMRVDWASESSRPPVFEKEHRIKKMQVWRGLLATSVLSISARIYYDECIISNFWDKLIRHRRKHKTEFTLYKFLSWQIYDLATRP
jgi:hypothetical protein